MKLGTTYDELLTKGNSMLNESLKGASVEFNCIALKFLRDLIVKVS